MTNNIRFTFSVNDTTKGALHVVLSKANRIGDIEYNVQCSPCLIKLGVCIN